MMTAPTNVNVSDINGEALVHRLKSDSKNQNYPVLCQWEITCRCNFKCVMCYTDCFNTPEWIKQELSTSEIFRIMDEMKEAGLLELVLTGGEPMSRPDFQDIYLKAIESGFLTTVFTNGWFITDQTVELWKNFTPNRVEISYHASKSETFDQITGVANSQPRVLNAIRLLYDSQIPLTVKLTGLTLNQNEILDVKKLIRSMPGVNFRFGEKIRLLANGANSSLKYQLNDQTLDSLIDCDPELKNAADNQTRAPEFHAPCHSGVNRFHIDAYGNLQLCSNNRRNSYSLRNGNFKDGFYQKLPAFACPNKSLSESHGRT